MSQDVASSWVSTEVHYTPPIDDKPTKEKLKLIGNAQKRSYPQKGGKQNEKCKWRYDKRKFSSKKIFECNNENK